MRIDVTTTTVAGRYELLDKTYSSFVSNLRGIEWGTLFLNIDRFPNVSDEQHRADVIRCLDIAGNYFPNVRANDTHTGCFPRAIKWLWGNAQTDCLLHLEDDWELMLPIELSDMLAMFAPETVQVSLRAYYRLHQNFALVPSLIRRDCYRAIAKGISETMNPEVWIRCQKRWTNVATYPPLDSRRIVVKDLGRAWLDKSPWRRGHLFEDKFIGYAPLSQTTARNGRNLTDQARVAEESRARYGVADSVLPT
jgi:hypothetical protein